MFPTMCRLPYDCIHLHKISKSTFWITPTTTPPFSKQPFRSKTVSRASQHVTDRFWNIVKFLSFQTKIMASHVKGKYIILPDHNSIDEFVYESPCSQCSKHRQSLILTLVSLELVNIVVILLYWMGTRQGTADHRNNCEPNFKACLINYIFFIADRSICL